MAHVYLAAYPHHSLHVYICEAGLRLYSVTYLPTIERMTEVERGQEGPLEVLYFKREARGREEQCNCSDSSDMSDSSDNSDSSDCSDSSDMSDSSDNSDCSDNSDSSDSSDC